MKFYRVAALIERDMRKFLRSPAQMMASMVFPLLQLVVLGYAFGGHIKGVTVAVVDQDHTAQSRQIKEMIAGIREGPHTFTVREYNSLPDAIDDLKAGFVRGVISIPQDFSRRFYHQDRPRIALAEDNTDQFISSELLERVQQMVEQLNAPSVATDLPGQVQLNVVEMYPYIEYIKYLLAGSVSLCIFVVAMIGGGITFIDDKSRGLHEGYPGHSDQQRRTGPRSDRCGHAERHHGGHGAGHHRLSDRRHHWNLEPADDLLSEFW